MRHERAATLLDEYLGGSLPAVEVRALEAHLAGCAACRRDLAELRALLAAAADLPAQIAPGRDLWPGIAQRLSARPRQADAASPVPRPVRRPVRRPAWRAVLAVAATVALLLLAGELPRPAWQPGTAPAEVGTRDEVTIEDVETVIAQNLRIVDLAIADIDRQRAADQEDPGLARRLASAHRLRAGLLVRRAELVALARG